MTGRTTRLTADETVEAASRLLHRDGPDAFSMRRLAAELDVNPMTIYLRFENKEALLRAVGERRLRSIQLPAREGSWEEQVLALAHAVRDTVLASGTAAALLAGTDHDISLTVVRLTEHGLWLMESAGLHGDEAVQAYRAVFWHAVGSAMAMSSMLEVGPKSTERAIEDLAEDEVPTYRRLRDRFGAIDPTVQFEQSLRWLVRGIVSESA